MITRETKWLEIKQADLAPANLGVQHSLKIERLLSPRPGFPDVNIAVEIVELDLLAAAINSSANGFVDLDAIASVLGVSVGEGLLGCTSYQRHIEVAEDFSTIGTDYQIGFQICRKGYVDVAVQRTERHGLC